jgi:hypothetical protein
LGIKAEKKHLLLPTKKRNGNNFFKMNKLNKKAGKV